MLKLLDYANLDVYIRVAWKGYTNKTYNVRDVLHAFGDRRVHYINPTEAEMDSAITKSVQNISTVVSLIYITFPRHPNIYI